MSKSTKNALTRSGDYSNDNTVSTSIHCSSFTAGYLLAQLQNLDLVSIMCTAINYIFCGQTNIF